MTFEDWKKSVFRSLPDFEFIRTEREGGFDFIIIKHKITKWTGRMAYDPYPPRFVEFVKWHVTQFYNYVCKDVPACAQPVGGRRFDSAMPTKRH